MPQIPPITDAYIDEIIKASDAYNPTLNKTQGVKLRELIKLMRDRSGENDYSGVWENNTWRPYHSVAEALAALPSEKRFIGMTVYILDNGKLSEFWFNNGVDNADLLEKSSGFSVSKHDLGKKYSKNDLVWVEENGYRVLYQSNIDNNLNNPLMRLGDVDVRSGMLDSSAATSTFWQQGWYFDSGNNWTPDHTTDFSWYSYGPWQTRVFEIDSPPLPSDFSAGVGKNSINYIASYQSGNPADQHFEGDMPSDKDVVLDVKVFDENGILLFHCKPAKMFYYLAFKIIVKLADQIYTVSIPQNSTDFTISPLIWKKIGYDKIDTNLFLDITSKTQSKAGNLTIQGIAQFELQTNSKNKRVLYEINPYSQRDTQNGYIEESTFQIPVINEGKLHDYRILGYFYSEGYFDNSLEIVLTAYTGLTRKYVLFNSEGRGEGSGSGFLGAPSTWFKLVPDIDGGGYGTGDIQLEALWHYPHGWYIRAKVVLVADAENGGGDGGVSGFSMYVKTYQGTFTRIFANNDDIITTPLGIPNRGNDPEPTTLSFGTAKFAQSLKVYKTPTDEFDVIRLKDLSGSGGNPAGVDYIQASPATPQDANINISGNLSAGGSIVGRTIQGHATNENGNVVGVEGYSLITNDDGYGGHFFAVGTGEQENRGVVVGASGGSKNIGLEIYDTPAGDNNYAIYSGSTAQSFFAGNIRANANLLVANTLDGATVRVLRTGTEDLYNFYVDPNRQRVYLGMGTTMGPENGPTVVIGDYDTGINWNGDGDISLTSNNNNVITVNSGNGINFKVQQEWNFGSWGNGISYLIYNNVTGDLAHVSAENMPFLSKDLAGSYILRNPETPQSANISIEGEINIGSGDNVTTIKRGANNVTHFEANGLEIYTNYNERKLIAQFGESYNTFYGAVVANNLTSGAYNYFESQNSASNRSVGIGSERGLYYTKEENGGGTSLRLLANDWSQNRIIYLPDADGTVAMDDQVLHKTGNETKNGDLSVDGKINASQDVEISDSAKGLILVSPNGTRWRVTVSDSGILTTAAVV